MPSTTIRLPGRRVHIVRSARDCEMCENHEAHTAVEARSFVQGEIISGAYRDASALADCRDLAETYGLLRGAHSLVDSEVLDHIAWLLETGRLLAFECRVEAPQGAMISSAAPPRPAGPRPRLQPFVADTPIKTWVEIELLDDQGKPVANERYLVTVPEGVVKDGSLDAQGRALIRDIDPGTCTITFPNIDGREWKPA